MAGGMSKPSGGGDLAWEDANAYQLICEVGKGGMASVCLALLSGKAGFQKLVALKQPGADLRQEPELLTMFLDEARLAARLNHPNVVQTYEVGLRDSLPFIAMEFVDGQPLSRIRHSADLPLSLHLCIIAEALLGLHHAHELCDFGGAPLHVVHRDVSPQNVLVSYDGQAKLVDFGIAKAHTQLNQTLAGCVKGKIPYMSPEQIIGDSLDRRADLFAVGVLLWEACARQRLWPGIPARERVRLLQAGETPKLTAIDPSLPAALERICRRALEFSPERRYQTAAEIEAELQGLLAGSDLYATRRDVAAFMACHFEAERAETRQLIESKLGHLSVSAQLPPSLPLLSSTLVLPPPEPGAGTDTTLPSERDDGILAQLALAPAIDAAVAPSRPSLSAGTPRNSLHSWAGSAPPPPPSSSVGPKPFAVIALAALLLLLGVGAGTWALRAAWKPGVRAAAAPPKGLVQAPVQPAVSAPEAPLVVSERPPAPPEPEQAAVVAPSRASKAIAKASKLSALPGSAPSVAPVASVIAVTDFGGRR
jgi:eukaryotic-like serine/threonine-protein kinase